MFVISGREYVYMSACGNRNYVQLYPEGVHIKTLKT